MIPKEQSLLFLEMQKQTNELDFGKEWTFYSKFYSTKGIKHAWVMRANLWQLDVLVYHKFALIIQS